MNEVNPTKRTYDDLNRAYDFFNERLFSGRLPRCLITMQRRPRSRGYFCGKRFATRDGKEVTDEIALNPQHFKERTPREILSTLVHEMTHLEQEHFGKPSRGGYHNKGWAALMKAMGLIPSDTGIEGGKQTGQRVTHHIEKGGPFDRACAELLKAGCTVAYVEAGPGHGEETKAKTARKKAASKTKYTCPGCGLNAWAKPDVSIICSGCDAELQAGGGEQ
jgi:ribosomal protein L37AE/L43A